MEARKMSVPRKLERSFLSHDEYETIRLTHHPAIYDVEPAELEAIRPACAKCAPRSKTLSRQKRREARGKRAARGASFPGTAERPSQRKQVFAAALKRINKELERHHNLAARTAHVEAARQALAQLRAANFIPYPPAGATGSEGMAPHPSRRRKTIIEGAKIGRTSQATKITQAVRDTRGG
jgi:outer membrane protein TolC